MFRMLLLISLFIFIQSCKDDEISEDSNSTLKISVGYMIGDEDFMSDSVRYTNQAGIPFSVTRLEYFLSDPQLLMGGSWKTFPTYAYFNPMGESDDLHIDVESGMYDSIRFTIGLSPTWNISGALPSRLKYINMAWPDVMGGGYHFLKLEGHYPDTAGNTKGYALHVGNNQSARQVAFKMPGAIREGNNRLMLRMDIRQWMGAEHVLDFYRHPAYTMGIDTLMYKLADNGAWSFSVLSIE